jgi:hypothetical protein
VRVAGDLARCRGLPLREEGVDRRSDRCGHGCRHDRCRQLPAEGERALECVAGAAAMAALREMIFHLRAHTGIDVAFEVLREQRQHIGAR